MKRTLLFILAFVPLIIRAYTTTCHEVVIIGGIKYELTYYEDIVYLSFAAVSATVLANDEGKYSADIVIPESIDYQFGESSLTFPVTTIAIDAFTNCDQLVSVTIPKSIREIITSFERDPIREETPFGVDAISTKAFSGCYNLKDLYCYEKPIIKYFEAGYFFEIPDYDKPFDENIIKNVTLHVRDVDIEAFKADKNWSGFKEIVPIEKVTDFNLTYYVDGEAYKTVQYKYGDVIDPEPYPIKEFYTFSGWNNLPTNMPGKDINISGTFKKTLYKLTYYVDGEFYKSYEYEYGKELGKEAEPTKNGYSFSGWSEIPDKMPDHDVTVTGTFTPNTYKLTYKVDGEEYKVYDVDCDTEVVPEQEPSKKGMIFSGWSNIPEKMPGKDVDITGTFSYSKTTIDNVVYQVTDAEKETAAVIGNDGIDGVLVIVPIVDFDYTYSVTAINDKAFYGRSAITTVEIPATVTAIGERAFANIDKLTDVTILAEEIPETDRTAFENSYIEDYVTLHVPEASLEKYKAVAPWKNFKSVVAIAGTQKLPAPTVSFENGVLTFTCGVEDVKYNWTISSGGSQPSAVGSDKLSLPNVTNYVLSVYATKDGYVNSETTTVNIHIDRADVNRDGKVDAADHVELTKVIMSYDGSETENDTTIEPYDDPTDL